MPTDLPEPVVPAIKRCGILARSAMIGAPPISLPRTSVRRAEEVERRQHMLVVGVEIERRLADRRRAPSRGGAGRLGGDEIGRQGAARLALDAGLPAVPVVAQSPRVAGAAEQRLAAL